MESDYEKIITLLREKMIISIIEILLRKKNIYIIIYFLRQSLKLY